jgi:hypothetical protein
MRVNAYGEHNGVEVFWHVCFYDDVLQCMCLVRCVWIHTLGYASFFSWFPLSYNGSFARVWIVTSLNTQALTLAPDNLLLFSLPGAVGVSEVQKRQCAHFSLTPVLFYRM